MVRRWQITCLMLVGDGASRHWYVDEAVHGGYPQVSHVCGNPKRKGTKYNRRGLLPYSGNIAKSV